MTITKKYLIPIGTQVAVVYEQSSVIVYTDVECIVSPTHNFSDCYYNPGGNIVVMLDTMGHLFCVVAVKDCIKLP